MANGQNNTGAEERIYLTYPDLKEYTENLINNAAEKISKKYDEKMECSAQCEIKNNFVFDWMVPIQILGKPIPVLYLFGLIMGTIGGTFAIYNFIS